MRYESRLRTNIRICLLAGAVAATAFMMVPIKPASACSPPYYVDLIDSDKTVRKVPVDGPLSVMLHIVGGPPDTSEFEVAVTDESGAEIAGDWKVMFSRLLWTPEAPLAADAVYQVSASDGWNSVDYQFETTSAEPPPLDNIQVVDSSLKEVRLDADVVCCDPGSLTSCGYANWAHCWAERFEYEQVWRLQWEPSTGIDWQLFVEYGVSSDTARWVEHIDEQVGAPREVLMHFPEGTSEYCVTLVAYDHFTGSEATHELCADPDDLETIPRLEPEVADPSLCEGPLIDRSTGMEIEDPTDPDEPVIPETPTDPDEGTPGDGGGCAATSPTSGGWLLLLSFVALWTARRRRCVRS